MDKLLSDCTTEELTERANTLVAVDEPTSAQYAMLFSIFGELIKRGEMPEATENDKENNWNELQKRIKMSTDKKVIIGNPYWFEDAMRDAKADRLHKKLKRRRRLRVAAYCLLGILLVNQITSSVSGFNPISAFFQWTGTALFTRHDGDKSNALEYGEWQSLYQQLKDWEIDVSLPTEVPGSKFIFSHLEIVFDEEPYVVFAWVKSTDGREFSLKIDGSIAEGNDSMNEVNDLDGLDPIRHNNMLYEVFINHDLIIVYWEDGGYQLVLQGEITYSEAVEVIQSIEK